MVESGRFMAVRRFYILDEYITASLHLEMSQHSGEVNDAREREIIIQAESFSRREKMGSIAQV